jgi:hypothetical protein
LCPDAESIYEVDRIVICYAALAEAPSPRCCNAVVLPWMMKIKKFRGLMKLMMGWVDGKEHSQFNLSKVHQQV